MQDFLLLDLTAGLCVCINMEEYKKKILCVGLVCLDIINVVEKYPEEDTDSRCLSQRWQRGGNASNSCTVLSLLGAPCAFMGSLSSGYKFHIDVSLVSESAQCELPASVVISNINTGSRTILHMNSFIMADFSRRGVDVSAVVLQVEDVKDFNNSDLLVVRNLPDVTAEDFSKVDLHQFKWIHWEGRNAEQQVQMIQQVEVFNRPLPPQERITLSVFVSKDVARHFGFQSAGAALKGLYSRVKQDAFPPETLVDTLGAGDTFNSAVIYTLSNGETLHCPTGDITLSNCETLHCPTDITLSNCETLHCPTGDITLSNCETLHCPTVRHYTVQHETLHCPTGDITLSNCETLHCPTVRRYTVQLETLHWGSLQDALTFGCRVAGRKCGFHGYDGIAEMSAL
ncbi:hypothetical protein F7725_016305 [Dissostichus mawsoni]|uniref:Carbohydrate kinase PfkB domain-containing protein n=1 Tax=Dissostichus mawsoni TaxID=36200 RepID=A0A7J5Z194_DISMA|nr:hypothetical protein F7725_016305 [Dissostichus mawsoni]